MEQNDLICIFFVNKTVIYWKEKNTTFMKSSACVFIIVD